MALVVSGRAKHVPQRTCVGCRREAPKREMVRVVRTPSGRVEVDPTGKKAGRGAYLCRREECWRAALGKARLERALHALVGDEDKQELVNYLLAQVAVWSAAPAGGDVGGE